MKTFRVSPIQNDEILQWLWKNVGPGCYWQYPFMSREIEPAEGDEWGYCHTRGYDELFILDDEKATLFALRWL